MAQTDLHINLIWQLQDINESVNIDHFVETIRENGVFFFLTTKSLNTIFRYINRLYNSKSLILTLSLVLGEIITMKDISVINTRSYM